MFNNFVYLLFFITTSVLGQKKHDVALVLSLQPEITNHLNNYSYRWEEKFSKSTFNIGGSFNLQYNLAKGFYFEAGLGYIARKLKTTVFLNQGALPKPQQSLSQELVTLRSVTYQTLELPVLAGYKLHSGKKINFALHAGVTGHFLKSAYYRVGYFKKYEGSYSKNYWNGYALLVGIGTEYKIYRRLFLVNRVSYTWRNTVRKDSFLFSQDEHGIGLKHDYQNITLGIKLLLDEAESER